MGISIHYSGRIDSIDRVKEFLNEMADICTDMEWEYHLFEEDQDVNGIIISVDENCEPLPFLFDASGRLCSMMHEYYSEEESEYRYIVSVKTQFTSLDIHIAIIRLLKYIKGKYIRDLNVRDEGEFWQTEDRALLQQKIEKTEKHINQLTDAININRNYLHEAKNAEDLADRLEELFKRMIEEDK